MIIADVFQTKAQWYNPDKVASKANIVYNAAISNAQDGKWNMAKSLLMKAISMDNCLVDAYLSYAGVSGDNKQYNSAIINYSLPLAWLRCF